VAQLGARLDGIEEVVGSNPIGSTTPTACPFLYTSYRANQRADFTLVKRKTSSNALPITTRVTLNL
jgi:hypothetical protein